MIALGKFYVCGRLLCYIIIHPVVFHENKCNIYAGVSYREKMGIIGDHID